MSRAKIEKPPKFIRFLIFNFMFNHVSVKSDLAISKCPYILYYDDCNYPIYTFDKYCQGCCLRERQGFRKIEKIVSPITKENTLDVLEYGDKPGQYWSVKYNYVFYLENEEKIVIIGKDVGNTGVMTELDMEDRVSAARLGLKVLDVDF